MAAVPLVGRALATVRILALFIPAWVVTAAGACVLFPTGAICAAAGLCCLAGPAAVAFSFAVGAEPLGSASLSSQLCCAGYTLVGRSGT